MKKLSLLSIVILASFSLSAQQPKLFQGSKNLMPIGVYYYPEQWPKNQWERDFARIARLGFEFVHLAEFAWARIEPQPDKFDFSWLDTCIRYAGNQGLKVILCTPTATPPAWLTQLHPEMLLVDENGITQRHGSRLHVNETNELFENFARRIITEMAKHYGKDPRIAGWQLDNEPHFGILYDYSETAQKGFRKWLVNKYSTIDALNIAWGTAFWSQVYASFDQVRIPNGKEAPNGTNPHAQLDFQRYTSDAVASFLRYQAVTLRQYILKTQWITTNFEYMKYAPPVDPFKNRKDLDFASHTMYLTSTYLNDAGGDLGFRLGSGMELSFGEELVKSVKGYTGIMELQPGQINWGRWNPQPLPGAVRMWIWHAYALGEKFVCTYRYRQPLSGGEMYHNCIMETDGITLTRGGSEFIQALEEIKGLKKHYTASAEIPHDILTRKTAFLWKVDNLFDLENAKQTEGWDSWQHYYLYYSALKSMGAPVTFLSEQDDFDPSIHPFMVAPAYQLLDTTLVFRWRDYVKEGGNLILTCRTGQKDNQGHLPETHWQERIWGLIGGNVNFYDHLPPGKSGKIKMGDSIFAWNAWSEVLEPDKNTKVLATYDDQFYKGKAAAITRKLGKGTVTYVGVSTINGKLEKQLLRKIYSENGANILNLPDYVFVEWRDGFWIAVNYSSKEAEAPLTDKVQILLGMKKLPPGGVVVWKE